MESGALRDIRRTVHFGLARQLDNAELIDHYPEPQGSRGGLRSWRRHHRLVSQVSPQLRHTLPC